MSNNAVTICTENTECILVNSQEFESTEQDRTAICSSNIEKDKKKYEVDFEMDNHRCCSFPMDNMSLQELDEGKTHSSSPTSTLLTIQVGKSWKFPANLTDILMTLLKMRRHLKKNVNLFHHIQLLVVDISDIMYNNS